MNLLRSIAAYLAHLLRRTARRLDGNREPAPMSPQDRWRGLAYLDKQIDELRAAQQIDWIHNAPERMPLIALNLAIASRLRARSITLREFCAQHKIPRILLTEALKHEPGAVWQARKRAAEVLDLTLLYQAAAEAARVDA